MNTFIPKIRLQLCVPPTTTPAGKALSSPRDEFVSQAYERRSHRRSKCFECRLQANAIIRRAGQRLERILFAALAVLKEAEWVAVRIGHPGGAEIGQEVVRWAERRCAVGGQACIRTVDVVGPKHDLDRPPMEARVQPVIADRGLDRGDPDGELAQGHLHVTWRTGLGCPEGFAKTETLVEGEEPDDVPGVNVDRGVPKHGWHVSIRPRTKAFGTVGPGPVGGLFREPDRDRSELDQTHERGGPSGSSARCSRKPTSPRSAERHRLSASRTSSHAAPVLMMIRVEFFSRRAPSEISCATGQSLSRRGACSNNVPGPLAWTTLSVHTCGASSNNRVSISGRR